VFKRFIDDGFVIFEGDKQKLLAFICLLKSLLPNIKITYNYSQVEVDFLDLVVYQCMEDACDADGKVRIKVRTHQKAMNKYLYIPCYSFHPPSVFRSFIKAELIRYVVTNSDKHWFDCMLRKFVHRLRHRGCPQRLLASITNLVLFSQRQQYLTASSSSSLALLCMSFLLRPASIAAKPSVRYPAETLVTPFNAAGGADWPKSHHPNLPHAAIALCNTHVPGPCRNTSHTTQSHRDSFGHK
jgi:hypothetical protein